MIGSKEHFLDLQMLEQQLENDLHANDYLHEYHTKIIGNTKNESDSKEGLKKPTFQEGIYHPR